MTIEQKAKAYDNLIERLKNFQSEYRFKTIEEHFPELKEIGESEDEKIKGAAIEFVRQNNSFNYRLGISKEEVIAWIEKQSEKPANKVEPKFKVGDWITDGNITIQIEAIKNNCYLYCGDCTLYSTKTADKVYHIWTIEDAKDGDVLCSGQIILLFKKWEDSDWNFAIAYAGIDITGKLQITNEHWLVSNYAHPATKDQCDALMKAMAAAGYTFDFEKKELKKIEQNPTDVRTTGYWHVEDIEQNPAWSEEEECRMNNLCHFLGEYGDQYYGHLTLQSTISWLRSLKGRVQPQPKQEWSEEDEETLDYIIDYIEKNKSKDTIYTKKTEILEGMIVWLKSLKDRVQPKQRWDKEDEAKRNALIGLIEEIKSQPLKRLEDWDGYISWLKSLRPQTTWKPTEEQIMALKWALNRVPYDSYTEKLKGLLEQLKQL